MALAPNGGLAGLAAKAAEKTQPATEGKPEVDHAADALKGMVSYSCRPMANYTIGKYIFEKGVLHLTPEDAKEFDKLWATQPSYLRHHVVKVDQAAAEARLAEILAGQGKVQSGMTSTEHNNAVGEKIDGASTDSQNTI